MKLNSRQGVIDKRRTLVGRAHLRGASFREIVEGLQRDKRVDPETGEEWSLGFNPGTGNPWSLGTIHNDIKHIHEQWRREATRDVAEYVRRQLAELQEVRREAYRQGRLDWVLKSLMQEAQLLGLNEPEKYELIRDADERRAAIEHDLAELARLRAGGVPRGVAEAA